MCLSTLEKQPKYEKNTRAIFSTNYITRSEIFKNTFV